MKRVGDKQFDVVIVGSGPAGVHAAYPLVEAGLRVAMIDGGLDSKKKDDSGLQEFPDAKITREGHYYDFIKNSSYVFNKTYNLLKVKSNVEIFQSLAKGGLSEIWHGICDFYIKDELEEAGLPVDIINREYKEVAKRIKLKTKPDLDFYSHLILEASKRKGKPEGVVYQVPLAFPYRTRQVVDSLRRFKNFTYIPNQLVWEVHDKKSGVEIQSISVDRLIKRTTCSKFLILAAGSINSTRILLRSLGLYNYRTSFLTKANYLMACFYPRAFFGKAVVKKSTGQVVIFVKGTFTQLYKLNPLVLENVLKYVPLPKFIALPMLSFFAPLLVIADVRFPSFESSNKYCTLKKGKDGKDVLDVLYQEASTELERQKKDCNEIAGELRSLGLFPLKTIKDHISSHYAGGVPFMKQAGKLSVDSFGKLHQAKHIYVADSSTWRALPAKSPTLTIMANAARVGKNVLKKFK